MLSVLYTLCINAPRCTMTIAMHNTREVIVSRLAAQTATNAPTFLGAIGMCCLLNYLI
jgi:hypothetical protein